MLLGARHVPERLSKCSTFTSTFYLHPMQLTDCSFQLLQTTMHDILCLKVGKLAKILLHNVAINYTVSKNGTFLF